AFPIEDGDQIILVTDGGQLIRCPVHDVRIASRNTQGVRIFRTGEDEKVVSVERIPEDAADDDDEDGDGNGEAPDASGSGDDGAPDAGGDDEGGSASDEQ
ncbi:MAG: DNA gyrase C-terminal beta-propeller domain-containing protein, partial [Pseudomonadota bacterium]